MPSIRTEVIDRCARCLSIKLIDRAITKTEYGKQVTKCYCHSCADIIGIEGHRVKQLEDRLEDAIARCLATKKVFTLGQVCRIADTYPDYIRFYPKLMKRVKSAVSEGRAIALHAALDRITASDSGKRPSLCRVAKEMGFHHNQQLLRHIDLVQQAEARLGKFSRNQEYRTLAATREAIQKRGFITRRSIAAQAGVDPSALPRHTKTMDLLIAELGRRIQEAIAHYTENPPTKRVRPSELAKRCNTSWETLYSIFGAEVRTALESINKVLETSDQIDRVGDRLLRIFDELMSKGWFTRSQFLSACGHGDTKDYLAARPELDARINEISRLAIAEQKLIRHAVNWAHITQRLNEAEQGRSPFSRPYNKEALLKWMHVCRDTVTECGLLERLSEVIANSQPRDIVAEIQSVNFQCAFTPETELCMAQVAKLFGLLRTRVDKWKKYLPYRKEGNLTLFKLGDIQDLAIARPRLFKDVDCTAMNWLLESNTVVSFPSRHYSKAS